MGLSFLLASSKTAFAVVHGTPIIIFFGTLIYRGNLDSWKTNSKNRVLDKIVSVMEKLIVYEIVNISGQFLGSKTTAFGKRSFFIFLMYTQLENFISIFLYYDQREKARASGKYSIFFNTTLGSEEYEQEGTSRTPDIQHATRDLPSRARSLRLLRLLLRHHGRSVCGVARDAPPLHQVA